MVLNRKIKENRRTTLYPLFYNMDYDCINKQHSNCLTQFADIPRQNEEKQRMRTILARQHRHAENRFDGDNNYHQQRRNLRALPEPADPNFWKDRYDSLFEFYIQTFEGCWAYEFERADFKETEGYNTYYADQQNEIYTSNPHQVQVLPRIGVIQKII